MLAAVRLIPFEVQLPVVSVQPAIEFSSHSFVVPTESPQFFSSYAATLVLIETIITMLLARAGDEAEDMIRAAENQIHVLGETWDP